LLPSLAASVSGWWHRLRGYFSTPTESVTSQPIDTIERPWRRRWDHLPKRSAGAGMSRADYQIARERAREMARATLGDELWHTLQRCGYLEVPSRLRPGITYRLRVGRRIEVLCAPGVSSPWSYRWLCINPTYPLPEEEFFAHLYLYARDREDILLQVAAPQPWDQALGRTF
jgi:hypothetical protein